MLTKQLAKYTKQLTIFGMLMFHPIKSAVVNLHGNLAVKVTDLYIVNNAAGQ